MMINNESMHIPSVNEKIRQSFIKTLQKTVKDPEVRAQLTPSYPPFCKRIAVHDDYWPVFNRANVKLVDDPKGVERITERGPVMQGQVWDADIIIYGTGFDVGDGNLNGVRIIGRNGLSLDERWADHAEAWYGMNVDGFPNMHIITGPTGLVFSMTGIASVEADTNWSVGVIHYMRENGYEVMDVKYEELRKLREENQRHADRTVWSRCSTYYNDDKGNILIHVIPWDVVQERKAKLVAANYPIYSFE